MRVAVFGATGSVGRHVVDEARRRGHDVVACSRSAGQDLVSGAGVAAALEGARAAIDVTNVTTVRRSTAMGFFVPAARTLQREAAAAHVAHLVAASIVGIDRLRSLGYYDAKLSQEQHLLKGPVPVTVLRATQFHELPLTFASRGRVGPVTFVPSMRIRTVAASAVASLLVDAATGEPWHGVRPDVSGPGPAASMAGLARATLAHTGSRVRVVGVTLLGAAARAIREGALLPAPDATIVGPGFAAWLEGPDAPARRDETS